MCFGISAVSSSFELSFVLYDPVSSVNNTGIIQGLPISVLGNGT